MMPKIQRNKFYYGGCFLTPSFGVCDSCNQERFCFWYEYYKHDKYGVIIIQRVCSICVRDTTSYRDLKQETDLFRVIR